MIDFVAGFLSAWILRALLERRLTAGPPDAHWMRSFTHECTNPPTGAPPLKLRRKEAPPTDVAAAIKPQPTGGHLVREGHLWGGYQPRPQGGTPNPPPAEP
jgi:hypothetical protein